MARPYYPPSTKIPSPPGQVEGGINPWTPGAPLYLPVYGYPTSLMQDQNPNYPYVYISVVDSVVKYQLQFVLALPLPNSCKVSYAADWEELNLGFLANIVDQGMKAYRDWDTFTGKQFGQMASQAAKEAAALSGTSLSEVMGQSEVSQAAQRQLGYMINPHAAVLFKGVPFRQLNFNWTLYPKNKQESQQIHNLIYALKWSMHPDLPVGSNQSALNVAFLKYPLNFVIEILAPHSLLLFRTSAMALMNCEVEYCGAGRPAFFQAPSDRPVAINLALTFKELEIITRKRIEQGW